MKKVRFLATILLLGMGHLHAQITDLYNFSVNSAPYADVTVSGNKLFGASNEGGKNGYGYFFSVNKDGSAFKDIWDCNDTGLVAGNANGGYPYGDVTVIANKLYGFNEDGGAYGYGNIFRMDTNGSGYKDLHDFNDTAGASMEWGALTLIGNKFFGMTYGGGAYGYGVIFSVDTNGAGYKDIFDFNDTNGAYPQSVSLAAYQDKLYGMTYQGGVNDSGVIFSIDTNGSGYKDLVDFTYSKGYFPYGFLTLVGKKLFGMTYEGGTLDSGVVFSVDTNGTRYKILVNMDSATGCFPQGALTLARNKLYSMTYQGGAHDSGDIFSIDTNGTGFKRVYDFQGGSSAFYPSGNNITVSTDTLFGMTWDGGLNGYGELFMLKDTALLAGINSVNAPDVVVKVYPNPNNGIFNIQIANSQQPLANCSIEIYNMLGEKIYAAPLNPPNRGKSVTTISLPYGEGQGGAGIYLYRILSETGELIGEGKVVVQR